jgi:hypothetical protein
VSTSRAVKEGTTTERVHHDNDVLEVADRLGPRSCSTRRLVRRHRPWRGRRTRKGAYRYRPVSSQCDRSLVLFHPAGEDVSAGVPQLLDDRMAAWPTSATSRPGRQPPLAKRFASAMKLTSSPGSPQAPRGPTVRASTASWSRHPDRPSTLPHRLRVTGPGSTMREQAAYARGVARHVPGAVCARGGVRWRSRS